MAVLLLIMTFVPAMSVTVSAAANIEGRLITVGGKTVNSGMKIAAEGCEWLLHEAFCLYSERDLFNPYEKHHSTVKDACELAQKLHVPNLVLYHTEDKNIQNRKELYSAEGESYFSGNLYIPNDLESIEIA